MQNWNSGVSVILPIYNKIEIIYECILQNAIHASEKNEWIIIDNDSDPETKAGIVRLRDELAQLGQRVFVITETTNTGVARAWNRGIAQAQSKYCLILNNDCVLQQNWDKHLLDLFRINDQRIVSAFIFEPGDFPRISTLKDFLELQTDLAQRNKGRFRPGLFVGITLFARRDVFLEVGAFDEHYWLSMEETDFLTRALLKGVPIGISGDILGFHFSSVTRKSVAFDHKKNLEYFRQKQGWDYAEWQASFVNKLIRSWQKRIKSYSGKLSEIAEILPNKVTFR